MRPLKKLVRKDGSVPRAEGDKASSPPGTSKHSKARGSKKKLTCLIRLLEDEKPPLKCTVSKEDMGKTVFDFVCEELGELAECDYFGLRYTDKYDQEQWLDLSQGVLKQVKPSKKTEQFELRFRLKHYPSNPVTDLKQDFTRYLVYQQLRRDLIHGRLFCPATIKASIGALIAQVEFGDAPIATESINGEETDFHLTTNGSAHPAESDAVRIPANYLDGFKMFRSQTKENEEAIMQKHEKLSGTSAQDAEMRLLERLSRLPTYGITPFPVIPHHKIDLSEVNFSSSEDVNQLNKRNQLPTDRKFNLGISGNGLVIFAGLKKVKEIQWDEIQRLSCEGKQFTIHLKREQSNARITRRHSIGTTFQSLYSMRVFHSLPWPEPAVQNKTRQLTFDCYSSAAALALWQWAVDRKCFFTLKEAKEAKRLRPSSSIFRRNKSYRFSGRSYMELSATPIKNTHAQFTRASSVRTSPRPQSDDVKNATLPGRLRPLMNLPETVQVGDVVELSGKEPTGVSPATALIVPDIIMEQPVEQAPLHVMHASEEPGELGETRDTTEVEPVHTSEDSPTVCYTASKQPESLSEETERCTHPAQEAMDIRSRVNSDLIESLVRKQVLSDMDQARENSTNHVNNLLPLDTNIIPNGELHGTEPSFTNGSLSHKTNKTDLKRKMQEEPIVQDGYMNPEHYRKDPRSQYDTKFSMAAAVVVLLVGAIVVLETSSHGNNSASHFLRGNIVVSTFDYYIYNPVRSMVAAGLSFIWPWNE